MADGLVTVNRICDQLGVPKTQQARRRVVAHILDRTPFDSLHLARMAIEGEYEGIDGLVVQDHELLIDDERVCLHIPVRQRKSADDAGVVRVDVITNDLEPLAYINDELLPAVSGKGAWEAEELAIALQRRPVGELRLQVVRDLLGYLARLVRIANRRQAALAKPPPK